jgi:hypothetical protein
VADHEKRLIDWVLENKDPLKFSCTRYSWIDQILPGYFDFSVSMCVDGVDVCKRHVGSRLSPFQHRDLARFGIKLERGVSSSRGASERDLIPGSIS